MAFIYMTLCQFSNDMTTSSLFELGPLDFHSNALPHIMLRDLLTQIACNKKPSLTWYALEHVDSEKRKMNRGPSTNLKKT
jgi:hypothetical protein